jgi:hypothetical protein
MKGGGLEKGFDGMRGGRQKLQRTETNRLAFAKLTVSGDGSNPFV